MQKIIIINYGLGNLGSISNMLRRLGYFSQVTDDERLIAKAEKIILPGVGHFKQGMLNLSKTKIPEILAEAQKLEKPILGICLGAQLLTRFSEEGQTTGLGLLNAKVVKFDKEKCRFPTPHMGWNFTKPIKKSRILPLLDEPLRFYFVHNYHFQTHEKDLALTETLYGYSFLSALEKENTFAVQFHPEKSHKYGMALMENFAKL